MCISSIAVFASGNGSNAAQLMRYFSAHERIGVRLVVTNNKNAGVTEVAKTFEVPVEVFTNEAIAEGTPLLDVLSDYKINTIVLAGFLRKIPAALIDAFPSRIINIHPSLLPKFGGKGMYGDFVHQAVLEAKENKTGITIHTIDERYDEGNQLAQFEVALSQDDTLDTLRSKVQALEHKHFAETIDHYITTLESYT